MFSCAVFLRPQVSIRFIFLTGSSCEEGSFKSECFFIQLQTFAALRAIPPAAEVSGLFLSYWKHAGGLVQRREGITHRRLAQSGGNPCKIHHREELGWEAESIKASFPDGEVEWMLLLGASLFGVMGDETPLVSKKRP